MKYRFTYLLIVLLATVVVSCQHEFPDSGLDLEGLVPESGSVITLRSSDVAGVVSLSVDAPALARFGVWIDLDGDGARAEDGTEEVKVFNAYQEYILAAGVKEIAVHGDITYFAAASNGLSSIEVSGNPYLTTLNVPMNNLTAIDLSQNRMLQRLDVSDNNLSSLDISANAELVSLWCFNNRLTALDVSGNTALQLLDCSGNALDNLDISANPQLLQLLAYNNRLTDLDVSANPLLHRLWAFGNPLGEDKTEAIVSSLRSATKGDLWLTEEPLVPTLKASAMEKGWEVQ